MKFAAQVALAARNQGKYEEMHWHLMSSERADENGALSAAEEFGLDIEKLGADMESPEVFAHIQQSKDLAEALAKNGTPAFIIGDQLVPGFSTGTSE